MYEDKVGRGQLSAAYSGLGQITSIVSPMLWGQVRTPIPHAALLASDCGLLATRVLLVIKLRLFWRSVGDGALGWCVGAQLYRFFLRKGMPSGYFFVPALFMYRPALPFCLLPPSDGKLLLAEHMIWTRLLQVGVVGYLEGCGPEDAFHRRRGGHNTQA